jgi:CBS domain-containing protein
MSALRDIMTTDLVTVSPDMSLQQVAEVFAAHHISGAPVVDGQQLVGVVTTTDLVVFETSNPGTPRQRSDQTEWGEWGSPENWVSGDDSPAHYFTEYWEDAGADVLARIKKSEGPEWNRLEENTVGEAMTTAICSLAPDASIKDAAMLMLTAGVHRILVVGEDEVLVGLVSTTDIMRAVADRGLGQND